MAGLTEFYCQSNETCHGSQFKWLDNTFKGLVSLKFLRPWVMFVIAGHSSWSVCVCGGGGGGYI
jgi:hypothetical protein